MLAALGLIASLILVAPSIFGHTLLVRTQLGKGLATHGWLFDVESTRIGWIAPLRLSGVRIHDQSSNVLHIDQITSDFTFVNLLFGSNDSLGEWVITGVGLHGSVDAEGRSSLTDYLSLRSNGDSDDPLPSGRIEIRDIVVSVADAATGDRWQFDKSEVEINLHPEALDAKFRGVFTEPSGKAGSFQGKLTSQVPLSTATAQDPRDADTDPEGKPWHCEIETETLPLSCVALLLGPIPHAASVISSQIAGEATGTIRLAGQGDGAISVDLESFEVRDLLTADPMDSTRTWSNQRAVVDGQLEITRDRVVAQGLRVSTDFASAAIDGAFPRSLTWSNLLEDPSKFLNRIDGSMTAEIDFASLQESLPDILPLRDRTKLLSGKITLTTEPFSSLPERRRRFALKTDTVRAHVVHSVVTIKPIEFNVILSHENSSLSAAEFRFHSDFANAVGNGDSQQGSADLDVDLHQLAESLCLITDLSDLKLGGAIHGNIRWNVQDLDAWRLTGSGDATDLHVTLNDANAIHQNRLSGQFNLAGRGGSQRLEELSQATLTLLGEGLDLRANLTSPVSQPTSKTLLPMHVEATGRLEELAGIVHCWTQKQVHDAEGQFDLNLEGDLSTTSARVTRATLDLSQPRIAFENCWFGQSKANVSFDGRWEWPSGDLEAKSLTVHSDAVSAEMRGRVGPNAIDGEISWRANLNRLSTSFHDRIDDPSRSGSQQSTFQLAASRSRFAQDSNDWYLNGDCSGQLNIHRDAQTIEIGGNVSTVELAVLERLPAVPGHTTMQSPTTATNDDRVIWAEPELKIDGTVRYDLTTQRTVIDAVRASSDWFATTLSGQAIWNADQGDVSLVGPLNVQLPELGQHLTDLAGHHVQLHGTHRTPLKIRLHRTEDGSTGMAIDGTLGWESGQVEGVKFGPASIPVRLSETSLKIAPSVVPTGGGKLNLAGEVRYRPGPITIRLQPGVLAESIQLTDEMTARWLGFIAPPIMRVENIRGTVGAELDDAIIVFGAPDLTHVSGRVLIQHMEMSLTPLMQELMDTLDKLHAIVHRQTGPSRDDSDYLITMPAQSVDFDLNLGLVDHKRAVIEIGQTEITSSGYITLDGRLAIIAKIPMIDSETDGDSQDKTTQFVSLPIFGTINQPLVSPTGLGNVASLITNRTAFDLGDELLREQLERDEVLLEHARALFIGSEELFEGSKRLEDGLQRVLERARERRQSKKSDEPASTIR